MRSVFCNETVESVRGAALTNYHALQSVTIAPQLCDSFEAGREVLCVPFDSPRVLKRFVLV